MFKPAPCLFLAAVALVAFGTWSSAMAAEPLRVAPFNVDATPPLGSPCAYRLAERIVDPLSARGIVILSEEAPIVLCAVDWIGIGNGAHDAWREALADAAGTDMQHVSVHVLHQHDAPACDLTVEAMLVEQGLDGQMFDINFARRTIENTANAVREAVSSPIKVTHLGLGEAKVEQVASNRRILGPDGKVKHVRFSACRNPDAVAAPEGVIDPNVKLIAFFSDDLPVASLTYYATHPQSYYRQGDVSADFVGMARAMREDDLPEVTHVHFNGASGNVAAGKYNDGSRENRPVLAARLAAGMQKAWDNLRKEPVTAADVAWDVAPVAVPARDTLDEQELRALLENEKADDQERIRAARDLSFLLRTTGGTKVELSCLSLGDARVLHMPGELFIEYQLAAQAMRPELFVCMAAYGDYGPGYIGTEIAYGQGGYETGRVSRTAPEVEEVLTTGMANLLHFDLSQEAASQWRRPSMIK